MQRAGDTREDLFRARPVMVIERRGPLIRAFVKRESLWVGKAERRIAADIGIVESRKTPVLVGAVGVRADEGLHVRLVQQAIDVVIMPEEIGGELSGVPAAYDIRWRWSGAFPPRCSRVRITARPLRDHRSARRAIMHNRGPKS